MAALIYQNNLLCGASLITDRFVLSAAHCVLRHNINDMYILVGDHDITIGSDTSESALYKIGAWEIYPNYQEATQYNDIAILQSQTQILFSPNIGPVCLPFRYIHQTFNGAQVYIIGWGQMTFGGSISRVLRKTQVQVISNAQCNSSQLERIDQGEICTYYQQEAKDSCQFDSGGPVAWFDPTIKRFQLLGIISHGVPCGVLAPSINTRVTEYLQWIMDRTETNYCVK
ncbi:hypothetical protein ABEB36_002199 [Hypothenemus hampei]|uniref:Peptidase S1 domain-containing protein n=1 Tax=Hypothenemus hampei TaxID=57062 RepID=A0ABD1F4X0_HYPHA